MKSLLLGFALGASSRGSNIRKITPLTTETESAVAISDKQLQVKPCGYKMYRILKQFINEIQGCSTGAKLFAPEKVKVA